MSEERLREAAASGASTLATGCVLCPFMLTDAAKSAGGAIAVCDVAEVMADRLAGRQDVRTSGNERMARRS